MPILDTLKLIKDDDGNILGEVIKAAPNTEPDNIYIRLQFVSGQSYKWQDEIDNYNDSISVDPTQEPRWGIEQMTLIYTDFSTGNDTTGTGIITAPYKTLGKAISVCNGGDTIMMGNLAAEVLTAPIPWTGAGTTTAISITTPLLIQCWNNGGTNTLTYPGGNIPCSEINGNSAAASIFSTTSMPVYVTLMNLKMHGTTSNAITTQIYWCFYQCEFYGISGTSTIMLNATSGQNTIVNCYFHTDVGTTVVGTALSTNNFVYGNYFSGLSGYSIKVTGNTNTIIDNVIVGGTQGGMNVLGTVPWICNNTIVGTGATNQVGISLSTTNHRSLLVNNLITDFSGTGAAGVSFLGSTTGANAVMFGYNGYRNNTTNIANKFVIGGPDLTANDVIETSTPYVSSGTSNYSLATGALSIGAGFPKGLAGSATPTTIDIGGSQKLITGGGSAVTIGSAHAT